MDEENLSVFVLTVVITYTVLKMISMGFWIPLLVILIVVVAWMVARRIKRQRDILRRLGVLEEDKDN